MPVSPGPVADRPAGRRCLGRPARRSTRACTSPASADFRLYQVELLCEQAELHTGRRPATPYAVRSAREAFELASSPDCQFVWGAAAAGHLLGGALLACGRVDDARRTLEATLSTRRLIGDFRAEQTEALLRSIRG